MEYESSLRNDPTVFSQQVAEQEISPCWLLTCLFEARPYLGANFQGGLNVGDRFLVSIERRFEEPLIYILRKGMYLMN